MSGACGAALLIVVLGCTTLGTVAALQGAPRQRGDATSAPRAPYIPSAPVILGESAVAARTAFSETRANDDGTVTATVVTRPLHWLDRETGQWRDFDDRLQAAGREAGSEGYARENSANGYTVRLGTADSIRAGAPAVQLQFRGAELALHPTGAQPADMETEAASATYHDAFPDTDLRYILDHERLKEEIVLLSAASAPGPFTFEADLRGAAARQVEDGTIELLLGDEVLWTLPRPYMWDSAPEPSRSDAVRVEMQPTDTGGFRLVLTPDQAWLADPTRVFPVVIDPTVSTTTYGPTTCCTDDVYLNQAQTTTNFSANSTLLVGKNATGDRRDSLVRFEDLDQLSSESAITSASLTLHAGSGTNGMSMSLYADDSAWVDTTATWTNHAFNAASTVRATTTASVGGTTTFNVRDLVGDWVAGNTPYLGVRIRSGGTNSQSVTFDSSEVTTSANRPQLSVTYVPASRLGMDGHWTYATRSYAGGTSSAVNLATGNLVVQHGTSNIPALGFTVDLTHTYNSQDRARSWLAHPISSARGTGTAGASPRPSGSRSSIPARRSPTRTPPATSMSTSRTPT